eukprot:3092101-Prorocentrum_lima.AAC.1
MLAIDGFSHGGYSHRRRGEPRPEGGVGAECLQGGCWHGSSLECVCYPLWGMGIPNAPHAEVVDDADV